MPAFASGRQRAPFQYEHSIQIQGGIYQNWKVKEHERPRENGELFMNQMQK